MRLSSICRTSARGSTHTSTRWPIACARRPVTVFRLSCATGRTRLAESEVEGACLVAGFESFVGQFPIPMRHGMTIGELASFFNEHFANWSVARDCQHGTMAQIHVRGRHWTAVGDAVPQHADSGRRCGLSGNRAVRGNQSVRGQGDDTAVRAGGGAVDRCRTVC